ncbi:MAG: hypothetical protein V2B18_21295 [Pseudomonadota bacterium]
MPTRSEVIAHARTLLGTPFHHQGRVPGAGLDCVGTPLITLWHFGLVDRSWDAERYSRQPNPPQIYEFVRKLIRAGIAWSIPKDERLPADVMLMRIKDDPQHFAWVTDIGMLHCHITLGVIEHGMDAMLVKSIAKVYRIRGVE